MPSSSRLPLFHENCIASTCPRSENLPQRDYIHNIGSIYDTGVLSFRPSAREAKDEARAATSSSSAHTCPDAS